MATVWWWIAALVFIVACPRQIGAAWASCCGLVVVAAQATQGVLAGSRNVVVKFLLRAGPVEPVGSLVCFALVALAIFAMRADYLVLLDSLRLILPWPGSSRLLATTLVGLTAGVGLLFHSIRPALARGGLLALALCLLGGQFLIAHERSRQLLELEEARVEMEDAADAPASLVVDGVVLDFAPAANGTTASPEVAAAAPKRDLRPLLAGASAFLFAMAEIVCVWGALVLGDAAICWTLAAPLFLLLGVLRGVAGLLAQLARVAGEVAGALLQVPVAATAAVRRLALFDFVSRWHRRRTTTLAQRHLRREQRRDLAHQAERRARERRLVDALDAQRAERFHQLYGDVVAAFAGQVAGDATPSLASRSRAVGAALGATLASWHQRLLDVLGRFGGTTGEPNASREAGATDRNFQEESA